MSSLAYLKVKIKSLAAEARIIRHAERYWKTRWRSHQDPTFFGLRQHRTDDVRCEARAALLAYGYLRGRAYIRMEFNPHEPAPLSRIAALASKYGPSKVDITTIQAWAMADSEKAAA